MTIAKIRVDTVTNLFEIAGEMANNRSPNGRGGQAGP
jgi:hypothetical protein